MSVTLAKNQGVSLSKAAGRSLTKVRVCLGWQTRQTSGHEFDLDASALVCRDASGQPRVLGDTWFVFYNQLVSPDGSVVHSGDNLVGGDGSTDDEVITVDLTSVAPVVSEVVFPVSIHDASVRRQNFGQVRNAFIRVVDDTTDIEVVRYNLAEEYSTETAVVFGTLYRDHDGWGFKAVGQGYSGGLESIVTAHGVNLS